MPRREGTHQCVSFPNASSAHAWRLRIAAQKPPRFQTGRNCNAKATLNLVEIYQGYEGVAMLIFIPFHKKKTLFF